MLHSFMTISGWDVGSGVFTATPVEADDCRGTGQQPVSATGVHRTPVFSSIRMVQPPVCGIKRKRKTGPLPVPGFLLVLSIWYSRVFT
jgi:hypothetical protein